MTFRDRQNIKEFFHLRRYNKATLARLYGLSETRIGVIIRERDETFDSDEECICGSDDVQTYYIDGNIDNSNPQNKIRLCKMDWDRIRHLQVRRIKYQS